MAQMLPYNHDTVHMFSKETPYVIRTKYDNFHIASIQKLRFSYTLSIWVWVSTETGECFKGENITHWLDINI